MRKMLLICFICLIKTFVLEEIIGRYVSIRTSVNPEYSIAFSKTLNFPFLDRDLESSDTVVILLRNKNNVIIKRRSKYLCVSENRLSVCDKPVKFSIQISRFGHKIKYLNRCLTFEKNLRFIKCDSYDMNQHFIFDRNVDAKCGIFIKFPLHKALSEEDEKREEVQINKQLKNLKMPKKTKKALKKLWKFDRLKFHKFRFC